jgi:hypothetical protein
MLLERLKTFLSDTAYRKYITIFVGIAVGLLCLAICALLAPSISSTVEDRAITWLVELAGMAAGGFLGFLSSPKVPGEQITFLTVARALSAFLSGYALSKIDRLIDNFFQPNIYEGNPLLLGRLLICSIAMIVSFMIAYSYRVYVQNTPKAFGILGRPAARRVTRPF